MDRPITPIDEFERALDKAALTKEEYELIDYIRYTSVFTQPSLIKDLKRHQSLLFCQFYVKFAEKLVRRCQIISKK